MKFRCRMVDTGAMRDFTSIVNTISRMAKYCVLRLTPDELCFNVGDERIPVLWAVLSQQHFFAEYVMSGVSEQENEIYLEFDASMFARSLNSLRVTARSVKIKLTNKKQPCLTFDIDLSSLSVDSRQCMHDVPVKLIPRREWPEHKMPDIPEFDVDIAMQYSGCGPFDVTNALKHCLLLSSLKERRRRMLRSICSTKWTAASVNCVRDRLCRNRILFQISLEIPQLKFLRHIVDRMKSMSPQLTMIANKTGTLEVKIEVDYATVSTHFKGLQVWESNEEQETGDISATVSVKKLAMFLGWDILHPDSVKCNLLQEKMVKLTLDVGDHVKMHYFMPAIAS